MGILINGMSRVERKDIKAPHPKRHTPLISLLLWHKIVAVQCFPWHLAL